MGLLSPFNLLYLLSLAALVVIYLRSRSRPTLEVSSLILFEEVEAPVAKASRLRVDLLFWLEMLALGALSFAAAGLYLRAPAPAGHLRRYALVFDVAAAMGAREGNVNRLEEARREAMKLVAGAPAGDQFSVLGYALEAELVRAPTADREAIGAAVSTLKPLSVPSRPAALTAALMRARESDRIELFADRLPAGAMMPEIAERVRFHRIGLAADNVAIVSLDPGVSRASRGHCVVRNFSARSRLCELAIDCEGQDVLRAPLMLAPRGQLVAPFGPLKSGGVLRARILTPDALEADNQRYAFAPGDRALEALVVSPDAQVRDDLARVLLAVDQSFVITTVDPKSLRPGGEVQAGHRPALAVMHDFFDPKVRADSRLLIFPKGPPELGVGPTLPLSQLEQRRDGGALARLLVLGAARKVAVPDWMEVLAQGGAPGERGTLPLVAIGRNSDGRLGLVAFDVRDHLLLDPDRLDALVLTVDLLKRLVAPPGLQVVTTGAYVAIPAPGGARVLEPDGTSVRLEADGAGYVRLRPLQSGRYTIESQSGTEVILANYYDAVESDLAAGPAAPPTADARRGLHDLGPSRTVQARPVARGLVALAMLALVLESALLLREAARGRWRHV